MFGFRCQNVSDKGMFASTQWGVRTGLLDCVVCSPGVARVVFPRFFPELA